MKKIKLISIFIVCVLLSTSIVISKTEEENHEIVDKTTEADKIQKLETINEPIQISDNVIKTGDEYHYQPSKTYQTQDPQPSSTVWHVPLLQYRKKITINSSQIPSDLENFPICINITDSDLANNVSNSSGYDIAFGMSPEGQLNHEIELYDNTTGQLVAWVNVTSLAHDSDSSIWMYYGNGAASNQENGEGVWDSNYLQVSHYNGDFLDSTSNDRDGTNSGSDDATGMFANCREFIESNTDYISYSDIGNLNTFTISIWGKADLYDFGDMFGNEMDIGMVTHADGRVSYRVGSGSSWGNGAKSSSGSVSDNTWTYYTGTSDGSTIKLFLDADEKTSASNSYNFDSSYYVGAREGWIYWFDGLIDEVRVSDVDRSSDWISTSYNTMNNATDGGFFTLNTQETQSPQSLSEWTYCQKITLNASQIPSDQTNFPICLNFTSSFLQDTAYSDGRDILFTNASATNESEKLNHEIELFDQTNGQLTAWINMTSLNSTTDQDIYMYWGNINSGEQENVEDVWDSNFIGVYHGVDLTDSTSNDKDLTNYNTATIDATGKLAGCFDFEGTNHEYVNNSGFFDLNTVSYCTITTYYNIESFDNAGADIGYGGIFVNDDDAENTGCILQVKDENDKGFRAMNRDTDGTNNNVAPASPTIAYDTWYHLSATYESTHVQLFVNGTLSSGGGSTVDWSKFGTTDIDIGRARLGKWYDGKIDEIQISKINRSSDWLLTTYNTMNNATDGGFFTLGNIEGRNLSEWTFRKKITINSSQIPSTLSNFPVCINITDPDLCAYAQSDGDDILFMPSSTSWTTDNNSEKYNHEIEQFSCEYLTAWVNITNLTHDADVEIYMYYGNSDVGNQESVADTWDSNYVAVWHMNNDLTVDNLEDSTVNSNDGTPSGTWTSSDLLSSNYCGYALEFDGNDEVVDIPNNFGIFTDSFTISTKLKTGTIGTQGYIVTFRGEYAVRLVDDLDNDVNDYFTYNIYDGSQNSGYASQSANTNYVFSSTYNGSSQLELFKDGSSVDTDACSDPQSRSDDSGIGKRIGAAGTEWNGIIDEFRISSIQRSDSWISTVSNTMTNSYDGGFFTLDSQEGTPTEWWNTSWEYSKRITINHSQVPSCQENFPILINITDTDLQSKALSTGYDIAFIKADNETQYNHEIELYNSSNGHLVVWVNVTSLSSNNDTVIYMYYNNSAASNQQNVESTWDSNYIFVSHMADSSGGLIDSTSNDNDFSENGNPTYQQSTPIGYGIDFDGTGDYFSDSDNAIWDTISSNNEYSIFYYGMISDNTEQSPILNQWYDINSVEDTSILFRYNSDFQSYIYDGSSNSLNEISSTPSNDTYFTYYTSASSSDKHYTKYNTNFVSTSLTAIDNSNSDVEIGNFYTTKNYYGVMDEIRVSNIHRSTDWMNTSQNNLNNATDGGFFTLGSEGTTGAVPTVSIPYVNNLTAPEQLTDFTPYFNWTYSSSDTVFNYTINVTKITGDMPIGADYTVVWNHTDSISNNVTYNGSTLIRGETYNVSIRVNNSDGWSDWNQTQFKLNELPDSPTTPKCEDQINPTQILTTIPTLSWTFNPRNTSDTQGGFNIIVGTSEDDDSLWNSTQTSSTSSVTYGGAALSRGITYHWKVSTNDTLESAQGDQTSDQTFKINSLPTATPFYPTNNSEGIPLSPELNWTFSDADSDTQEKFHIQLSNQSDFSSFILNTNTTSSQTVVNRFSIFFGPLENGTQYYWRLKVNDSYEWSDWIDGYWTFNTTNITIENINWYNTSYTPTTIFEVNETAVLQFNVTNLQNMNNTYITITDPKGNDKVTKQGIAGVTDDFEDQSASDWDPDDPTHWTVYNDTTNAGMGWCYQCGQNGGSSDIDDYTLIGENIIANQTNVTITTEFQFEFSPGDDFARIIARFQDSSNYVAAYASASYSVIGIEEYVSGVRRFQETSHLFSDDIIYELKLAVSGSDAAVYIDSDEMVSKSLSNTGSGRLGLGAGSGWTSFDNFTVGYPESRIISTNNSVPEAKYEFNYTIPGINATIGNTIENLSGVWTVDIFAESGGFTATTQTSFEVSADAPIIVNTTTYNNTYFQTSTFNDGDDIHIKSWIVHKDGRTAIDNAKVIITDPTDVIRINNLSMDDVGDITDGNIYEYNLSIPETQASDGTWTIVVNSQDTNGNYSEQTETFDVEISNPVISSIYTTDPSGNKKYDFNLSENIRIRAEISDPDGRSDIDHANVTIVAPNGTVLVSNSSMTDIANIYQGNVYEYSYSAPSGYSGYGRYTYIIRTSDIEYDESEESVYIVVWANTSYEYRESITLKEEFGISHTNEPLGFNITLNNFVASGNDSLVLYDEKGKVLPFKVEEKTTFSADATTYNIIYTDNFTANENKTIYLYYNKTANPESPSELYTSTSKENATLVESNFTLDWDSSSTNITYGKAITHYNLGGGNPTFDAFYSDGDSVNVGTEAEMYDGDYDTYGGYYAYDATNWEQWSGNFYKNYSNISSNRNTLNFRVKMYVWDGEDTSDNYARARFYVYNVTSDSWDNVEELYQETSGSQTFDGYVNVSSTNYVNSSNYNSVKTRVYLITNNGHGGQHTRAYYYDSELLEIEGSYENIIMCGRTGTGGANLAFLRAYNITFTDSGTATTSLMSEIKWNNSGSGEGFGYSVNISDVDGDGIDEIITAGVAYDGTRNKAQLSIWNWTGGTFVEEKNTTWYDDAAGGTALYCIKTGDVDGDGDIEILTCGLTGTHNARAQFAVHNYTSNGATIGHEFWHNDSLDTSYNWSEFYSIAIGDIYNDGGNPEVLVAGEGYDGSQNINGWFKVYGYNSGSWGGSERNTINWLEGSLTEIFSCDVGDVDNDGENEMVLSGNHYDGTRDVAMFRVYEATGAGYPETINEDTNARSSWYTEGYSSALTVMINDILKNNLSYITTVGFQNDGDIDRGDYRIRHYNGTTPRTLHKELWLQQYARRSGDFSDAAFIHDFNNDGFYELVDTGRYALTPPTGTYIRVQSIGGINKTLTGENHTGYKHQDTEILMPEQPSSLTSTAFSNNYINLSWTKGETPIDGTTYNTVIIYKKGTVPTSLTDGTIAYNGTASYANLTGLDNGTYYRFKAWSYKENDTTGASSFSDLNITTNQFSRPGNGSVTFSSSTNNKITINFEKGDNATRSIVIRNASGWSNYPTTKTNGTEIYNGTLEGDFEDTGLHFNTTYYYSIFSYSSSSGYYSTGYDTASGTTQYGQPQLTTGNPTGVEETNATLHGTLTEDGDQICTVGFWIDNEHTFDSSPSYIFNSNGATDGTTFSNNTVGLTKGETYYYRANGNNTDYTTNASHKYFITKPDAPTGLNLISRYSDQIELNWTKASHGSNSNTQMKTLIVYSTSGYPTGPSDGTTSYNSTSTSTTVTSLDPNTQYYFSAFAVADNDWETIWALSDTTDTYTTTTKPTPPSTFNARTVNVSAINLSWTIGDQRTVIIRNSTGSAAFPTTPTDGNEIYNGTDSYYDDYPLTTGNTYYYTAFSYNSTTNLYSTTNRTSSNTTQVIAPSVSTNASTGITSTNATLNGYLDDDGGEDATIWFNWAKNSSNLENTTGNTTKDTFESFSSSELSARQYYIRPNDNGSNTGIDSQNPGTTWHWDKVDEEAADDATTYVQSSDSTGDWEYDLYESSNYTVNYTINSVQLFAKVLQGDHRRYKISMSTHDTIYNTSEFNQSGSNWVYINTSIYTANPSTENAWTISELNDLEIGISMKGDLGFAQPARCTQIYAQINHSMPYNLTPGTLYYYQALANNSNSTTTGSILGFLTRPEAPTGASATQFGETSINLSWTNGTGKNKTYIERSTSSDPWVRGSGTFVANTTSNEYTDSDLEPYVYYYQFWSYTENSGYSQFSSSYDTTSSSTAANARPIMHDPYPANNSAGIAGNLGTWNITIEDLEGDTISWTIETSPDVGSNSSSGGNGSKKVDLSPLTSETTYTVYVNATDSGSLNWRNNTYYFTTESGSPVLSNPSPNSTTTIMYPVLNITINDPQGQTMNVTWYNNKTGSWSQIGSINTSVTNGTYRHNATFATNEETNYWWRVSVEDSDGFITTETYNFTTDSYTWSGWSDWWLFTLDSITPFDFTATTFNKTRIDLTWEVGANNDNTTIYRNSSGSSTYPTTIGDGTLIYNSTGTSYSDTGLNSETTYYYTAWTWNDTTGHTTENVTTSATTLGLIELTNPFPANESTGVSRPPTNLSITLTGLSIDVNFTFYNLTTGVWEILSTFSNEDTGRLETLDLSTINGSTEFIWGNTTYNWAVNATDGTNWENISYTYNTTQLVSGNDARFDVNNDGSSIDVFDLNIAWSNRDGVATYNKIYDINNDKSGDGSVDVFDLNAIWAYKT